MAGRRGVESAGSALGALAGVAAGGPAGAVIGAAATPYLIQLAGNAWDEIRGRREQSVARLLEEAANDLDQSPEQMVTGAMTEERTTQHLSDAMQAAAQTVSASKVRGLALALSAGLRDDGARLDEANLLLRALADLEPIHVRLLDLLRGTSARKPVELLLRDPATTAVVSTLQRHGLIRPDDAERQEAAIEQAVDEVLNYTDQEARRRERAASTSFTAGYSPGPFRGEALDLEPKWLMTPFGRECLAVIDRSAAEEAAAEEDARISAGPEQVDEGQRR